jgi:hypothetical protein
MFAIDHLAIWTAERDRLVTRIAELTGLPELDGFQPGGVIASRGVRFSGGPFLDIFQADQPEAYLGLRSDIAAAERLTVQQGWQGEREPRPQVTTGDDPPWDILYWAANRGVFSRLFVIEYATDPAAFNAPSYSGPLHKPGPGPEHGASLSRVWLGVRDPARGAMHLRALGFQPAGPVEEDAGLFLGECSDIVLLPCAADEREGIVRFDITGAAADAHEPFGEGLTLTALTSQG